MSSWVRFYQKADEAGISVKVDIYEAMPHNLPDRIPNAPEAILARKKTGAFLHQHLGMN